MLASPTAGFMVSWAEEMNRLLEAVVFLKTVERVVLRKQRDRDDCNIAL